MCDEHEQSRQCHGQEKVLRTFSQLAAQVRPKFHCQVMGLIANLQYQRGKPGQRACDTSSKDMRGEQKYGEADQYVQRVHADARGMFDEQLDLIPAEEGHELVHMRGLCQ